MSDIYQLELPYQADPCDYFAKLRHLPYAVLLDSCATRTQGRYDIMSAEPHTRIITRGEESIILTDDSESLSTEDPLHLVQTYCHSKPKPPSNIPFVGGAIGYCGYELGRRFEALPHTVIQDVRAPDMHFGLYHWSIVTDHQLKKTMIVSYQPDLDRIHALLKKPTPKRQPFKLTRPLKSNLSFAEYQQAFDSIMEHILAGDCYQANLSQRFSAGYQGDPWLFYRFCRAKNPAPYSAFIALDDSEIVSFSPELFLRVKDKHVLTKPIKGTRPRDPDPAMDMAMAEELIHDEKERAENLMIVDLLRNDLGRACRVGSIEVPKLFALESYPAVHHMVSSVCGELRDNQTSLDLLRQCFPGGSITGAPKISAMKIIDAVEKHQRSIYCGSIVAVDHNGDLFSNIAIRTLLFEDQTLYCSAGGAIVSDSTVKAEYQETLNKIQLISHSLQQSA